MDNEQRFKIPLDATFDITSDSMIANPQRPQFSYNKQKYTGRVMTNSVRYEADGWFAGWYQHNFDLVFDGTINIVPALGNPQLRQVFIKVDSRQNRYYEFYIPEYELRFTYTPTAWQIWNAGTGTVQRLNDTTMRVTGKTNVGSDVIVETDVYTDEVVAFSGHSLLSVSSVADGLTTVVKVNRLESPGGDVLELRKGQNVVFNDNILVYSRDYNTSYFGDVFSLTDTGAAVSTDAITIVNYVVHNQTQENEYTDVEFFINQQYRNIINFTITDTINGVNFSNVDSTIAVGQEAQIPLPLDADGEQILENTDLESSITQYKFNSINIKNNGTNAAVATIKIQVPIWLCYTAPIKWVNDSVTLQISLDDTSVCVNSIHNIINDLEPADWYIYAADVNEPVTPVFICGGYMFVYGQNRDGVYNWTILPAPGMPNNVIKLSVDSVININVATTQAIYLIGINKDSRAPMPVGSPFCVYTLDTSANGIFSSLPNSNGYKPIDITYNLNKVIIGDIITFYAASCFLGEAYADLQLYNVEQIGNVVQFMLLKKYGITSFFRVDGDNLELIDISKATLQITGNSIIIAYSNQEYSLYAYSLNNAMYGAPFTPNWVLGSNTMTTNSIQFTLTLNIQMQYIPSVNVSNAMLDVSLDSQLATGLVTTGVLKSELVGQELNVYADIKVWLDNTNWYIVRFYYTINRIELGDVYMPYAIFKQQPDLTNDAINFTITSFVVFKYTYHVNLYRSFILKANGLLYNAYIAGQQGSVISLQGGLGSIDISKGTFETTTNLLTVNIINSDFIFRLAVTVDDTLTVQFMPEGITARNTDQITYVSSSVDLVNYNLQFRFAGSQYLLQMSKSTDLVLDYTTTDIRNNQRELVYKRSTTDIITFLKQFWSTTVNTENFWYINNRHVLELTKAEMILWQNTGEVSDWNGNNWTAIKRASRAIFIDTQDQRYGCTSGYNGRAIFYKLQATDSQIKLLWLDPLTVDWNNVYYQSRTINVAKIELNGSTLSTSALSAFIQLNPQALITSAKISATVVNDRWFILGIAATRGLQQWAIVIDLNSTGFRVINGYGHVGVDGNLTGGIIPSTCMNTTAGYNIATYNVKDLPTTEGIPNRTYSNGNIVWFIYTDVVSITQALLFNTNGAYSALTLPLSNKYAQQYVNLSGLAIGLFDQGLQRMSVKSLLYTPLEPSLSTGLHTSGTTGNVNTDVSKSNVSDVDAIPYSAGTTYISESVLNGEGAGGKKASKYLKNHRERFYNNRLYGDQQIQHGLSAKYSWLLVVFMEPKYSTLAYINHSIGQYAYRYYTYNVDNAHNADDITFNVSKPTISIKTADDVALKIQLLLKVTEAGTAALSKVVNAGAEALRGNKEKAGVLIKESASFAVETLADLAVASFTSTGPSPVYKSILTGVSSLDMFYSISDDSAVYAGPGYTNINVIGQCAAQSATDTICDGKRTSYFATLPELSRIIYTLAALVTEELGAFMGRLGSGMASAGMGVSIVGTGFPMIPIGMIVGAVIAGLGNFFTFGAKLIRATGDIAYSLAQAIGSSHGEANITASIKANNLSIEAPHNYGNKPMSFMWPAFGVNTNTFTQESVSPYLFLATQSVYLRGRVGNVINYSSGHTHTYNMSVMGTLNGSIYSAQIKAQGVQSVVTAPLNTAVVEGVTSFLPTTPFKNEQIGVPPPTFPQPPIHDYVIDSRWQLGYTAIAGDIISVVVDDTKVIDGPPSNIIVTPDFCGIATSYTVIEVKKAYDHNYLRPVAMTADCILLNINRINCVQQGRAYHAADGQSNRILKWTGSAGMDKAYLYQQYLFQANNHFKRSTIYPPSQFFGAFQGPPSVALRTYDRVANIASSISQSQNIENNIPGELKDLQRYSIPIHSELLSSLPAMIRTLGPYKLNVVEGVTSLTTEIRSTQNAYKAPSSIDFNINGEPYRITEEFLCEIVTQAGVVSVRDIVATAGLTFIGATTKEAYFYSAATMMYYVFRGGRDITKADIMSRFRDVQVGRWDFVNQEVMFKALDKDRIVTLRMDNAQVLGEVYPATPPICRPGDYKVLSMAGGTVYQGPKRFVVNRYNIVDYMIPQIKQNKRRWTRMSRTDFNEPRDYGWQYTTYLNTVTPWNAVYGWTHNTFELETDMLGLDEENDYKFEWHLTFAWTEELSKIFEVNEFVCVNVQAVTATQGGMLESKVTHVYLYKQLFDSGVDKGYYTFQFQSNCGVGNRERLRIWSDAILALEDLTVAMKMMSQRRTQPLVVQQDVQDLQEL